MEMKKVIIADNQEITKAGILYLISRIPEAISVSEVENKRELVKSLMTDSRVLVVLDYTLFDLAGVEELLILAERFPRVRWLLFSESLSDAFIRTLVYSEGFFCMVLKDSPVAEITSALQKVLSGERYICFSVNVKSLLEENKRTDMYQELQQLTATEKEILKRIALGKTTKEIALERISSIHTIITHRKNIFRKLHVNNVHEATKYAMRAGIVDPAEYYI